MAYQPVCSILGFLTYFVTRAPQLRFRGVQIASGVDGNAFPPWCRFGRTRSCGAGMNIVYFAVFKAPDPNPPEPSRVNLFSGL